MLTALQFARRLLDSFESNNDFDLSELGINRHQHLQHNSNADIPAAYYSSSRSISYNSGLPVYGNDFRATSAYPGTNDMIYGLYGSGFMIKPAYPAAYGSSFVPTD